MASSAKTCPGCGAKNKKPFYKKWWVWFIVVIVLIGAAGSGANSNNNSSTEAASSNKVDTKKETTKITYENFLNIQMGQSYDEVVALLGEGKESSSNELAGIKTTLYEWKGSGMGNMNVTIQNGAVTAKAQAFLQKPNANITMDLYNQIQSGMTYDQVKGILGEGELTSETKIMDSTAKLYSYISKDGSNANFTFTNDSMDLKAQFNLK
ncbi:UNVERIFIED_ORG: beta-lactamase-inhibitor protein BLIP [Clostridium botulinum]